MVGVAPGMIFSSLPLMLAAFLLQVGILIFGMALDESYVNRATVATGAIAVQVHIIAADSTGLLVGLYADIGLLIGAYGIYTYVVDAYVGRIFRIFAFFVYSPLTVMLVILTAGFTVFGIEFLFLPALAAAGYGNLQLMAHLEPSEPYYFGPESPEEFEEVAEETDATVRLTAKTQPGESSDEDQPFDDSTVSTGGDSPEYPGATTAGGDSTDRGILPEFMRRL